MRLYMRFGFLTSFLSSVELRIKLQTYGTAYVYSHSVEYAVVALSSNFCARPSYANHYYHRWENETSKQDSKHWTYTSSNFWPHFFLKQISTGAQTAFIKLRFLPLK